MVKKRFLPDSEKMSRATTFAKTFHKIPSLTVHWTRCGNPDCRCARGELHGPYGVLRWREGVKQYRRYVPLAELEVVRVVLDQRRHDRQTERLSYARGFQEWRTVSALIREYETAMQEQAEVLP